MMPKFNVILPGGLGKERRAERALRIRKMVGTDIVGDNRKPANKGMTVAKGGQIAENADIYLGHNILGLLSIFDGGTGDIVYHGMGFLENFRKCIFVPKLSFFDVVNEIIGLLQ